MNLTQTFFLFWIDDRAGSPGVEQEGGRYLLYLARLWACHIYPKCGKLPHLSKFIYSEQFHWLVSPSKFHVSFRAFISCGPRTSVSVGCAYVPALMYCTRTLNSYPFADQPSKSAKYPNNLLWRSWGAHICCGNTRSPRSSLIQCRDTCLRSKILYDIVSRLLSQSKTKFLR